MESLEAALHNVLNAKFSLGMLSNITALYLVCAKSRKQMSEYRKLLIIFLVSDLIFSTVQEALQPMGVIDGSLFMVYLEGERQSKLAVSLYCGMISVSFLIFAFHFLYRAQSISIKSVIPIKLDLSKITLIIAIVIGECLGWAYVCHVHLSYEPSYLARLVRFFDGQNRALPVDLDNAFLVFVSYSNNGSLRWDKFIVIALLFGIIGLELLVITLSSIHIVKTLRHSDIMSETLRKMHAQLFKALIVQLAIPCALLYIPCAFYFVTPFLLPDTVHTPPWLITTLYSWFPIIDPLAIIFMITEYRRTVLNWLRLTRLFSQDTTTVHTLTATKEVVIRRVESK